VSSIEAQLERETLIGRGLTSDVFTFGHERVLKLYFPWLPATTAQRELAVTRAVHAAGIPVPAAFDILHVAGRCGIVFERVPGHSLVRDVETKPWTLFAAARQLAELHARLHATPAPPGLPAQRDQMERWINGAVDCSEEAKQAARQHLTQLPAGHCICHGDFHPANILLAPRGPVIIDWSTGTCGHGLADVARTSVLFESASLPEGSSLRLRLLMKIARRLLHTTYLKHYLELRPGTLDEIEFWRVPQRMAVSAWRAERNAALVAEAERKARSREMELPLKRA
jgi:uncharacterized protein (TIGR02172 family)